MTIEDGTIGLYSILEEILKLVWEVLWDRAQNMTEHYVGYDILVSEYPCFNTASCFQISLIPTLYILNNNWLISSLLEGMVQFFFLYFVIHRNQCKPDTNESLSQIPKIVIILSR